MQNIIRNTVMVQGLIFVLIGLLFLIQPDKMAAEFAISPIGSQGYATIRGDFTGFFVTGGLFAFYGAWKRNAFALWTPMVLVAIVFVCRIISIILDGMGPKALEPMAVEAVTMVILYAAMRSFKAES